MKRTKRTVALYLHYPSPKPALLRTKTDPLGPQFLLWGKEQSEYPASPAFQGAAQEAQSCLTSPILLGISMATLCGGS